MACLGLRKLGTQNVHSTLNNPEKEYGFDINKRVEGSGNTPVLEALALGKDEDPIEADKSIAKFVYLVHLGLKGTDQQINFNLKNNQEQSAVWSV